MSITFYAILLAAGGNDIFATTFHLSIQAEIWVLRVAAIVLPPIMFKITKRICLGLQHHDQGLLTHGIETGIIRRLPSGEYIEVEEPLDPESAAVLASQLGVEVPVHGHHAELTAGPEPTPPPVQTGSRAGASGKPATMLARAHKKLENFFFVDGHGTEPASEDDEPRTLSRP
jgi:ubiquinol-cytochrome c reductase cytochrome b subunit